MSTTTGSWMIGGMGKGSCFFFLITKVPLLISKSRPLQVGSPHSPIYQLSKNTTHLATVPALHFPLVDADGVPAAACVACIAGSEWDKMTQWKKEDAHSGNVSQVD